MATDSERLLLQMSADIRGLERAMAKAEAATDKSADKIESRFDKMNAGLTGRFGKLGDTLRTALAAVAVGAIVKDLSKLADTYTSITNQLRSYADILGDTDAAQRRLVDTSVSANTNLEASAAVLTAAARAARDIGRSGEEVFQFTEAVGKAASIANTGTSAVAGAITQLGQAVASPSVQLGEFNSIIEGTPRLAQAFADGIDRAEGSVSKLRKLIGTQQISGTDLFLGLLSQLPKIRQEFAAADNTIGAAFTNLTTRITAYVGEANEATGVTKNLVPVINFLANNVSAFADTAVVALVALSGALAGIGAAALLAAIGRNAAAILTTRAGMALLAAEATRLAVAQGTLTTANIGLYRSALAASTSINVLSLASRAGATAAGALNVALAAVGGPVGLLGVGVALLALRLADGSQQMELQARVAKEFAPELERIEKATTALSTATGELAAQNEAEAKAALKALIAKYQLAKANIALAESQLKLNLSQGIARGRAGELQAGQIAAQASEVDAQKRALEEQRRQIEAQIDLIAKAQAQSAVATAVSRPTVTPTTPAATGAAPTGKAATLGKDPKELANELAGLSDKARAARESIAAADAAVRDFRAQQESDADSFLDRVPGSARAARLELEKLRELFDAGVFARLGAEAESAGAEAQVQLLEEIAAASGDATEALLELARVNGLTAEEAEAAARRIREAARDGRAERDERLGRIFRTGEIRDDLKSALSEAFRTGDYGAVFEDRIRAALTRAADRSLDRFLDGVLDQLGAIASSGKKSGGGIGAFISSIIFGGKRATGGPVAPGRYYTVGERGPETFVPKTPGFIIPNGAGGGQVVQVTDARVITIAGASSAEMAQLRAQLDQDHAAFGARVAAVVKAAGNRRQLR